MEKTDSYFSDGEAYIISSSHNDIAFLDTPLLTILFRNKNIIEKAIDMIEKDSSFYHTIENSLYIKDFLLLNPELKSRLIKIMASGNLDCGATYTQLYETSVTSEGLVRHYYLGKRWLEKEIPGFIARTTWNQDVPARTMQSAQVMKKCGVDYLFVSRMNAGFFKWYSPDGSFVTGYSTGHYHHNSISNLIGLNYNVYDEEAHSNNSDSNKKTDIEVKDNKALEKLFNYLEKSATNVYKENKIPPLYCFLAIRDYDYPLNLNSYIKELENNEEFNLPKFKHATAAIFMNEANKILDKDSYWNKYTGERPNLWLYHESSHAKALKYSRNGLNSIDKVEVLASINSILFNSKYPKKEIDKCWEQLLYLDHGWGGNNGHITDQTYLEISKKGLRNTKNLEKQLIKDLANNITIKEEGSYITIFNASCNKRYDRVITTIDWSKLHTLDFNIYDENDNLVEYQIIEESEPYKIKILFYAKIDGYGYAQYKIKKENQIKQEINNSLKITGKHYVELSNKFYDLIIEDGGFTKIYDKQIKENILNENSLLKGFEIFMLDSCGNGSGEFSQIQQPNKVFGASVDKYGGMTAYNNTSTNNNMIWKIREHEGVNTPNGNVVTIIEGEAHFNHFTLIQQILIYNNIKKIETKVNIEAWDGTMYKELRMALPLKEKFNSLSYEVPFGILRLNKDEVQGVIGDKMFTDNIKENFPNVIYPTDCRKIHPREVQSWIGVESKDSTILLSCIDTPTFDYIDVSNNDENSYLIQPILFASRHSCLKEGGNPYHQRGSHSFSFTFSSNKGNLRDNVKIIEEEKSSLITNISYNELQKTGLPINKSCIEIEGDIRISCLKKAEDNDNYIVRVYEMFGEEENFNINLNNYIKNVKKTDMLEFGGEKINQSKITDKLTPYSIETYCISNN